MIGGTTKNIQKFCVLSFCLKFLYWNYYTATVGFLRFPGEKTKQSNFFRPPLKLYLTLLRELNRGRKQTTLKRLKVRSAPWMHKNRVTMFWQFFPGNQGYMYGLMIYFLLIISDLGFLINRSLESSIDYPYSKHSTCTQLSLIHLICVA